MRNILAVIILVVTNIALADDIVAPVQIDGHPAAIALEAPTGRLSALDELRRAINAEATKEHTQSQKDGWFISANKRFAPESMTFFLATGLVIYESAWAHAHGDPIAMERHILSLKDPIASMSFYAFMQANGFYMHYKGSKLPAAMDAQTRAQMMRRFSYGGMAWGSLASSLLSDVFSPFKPCLDKMLASDYRNETHYKERCENELSAAWAQWNIRNKFGQYAPQIMSLIISQKSAELVSAGLRGTMNRVSKSQILEKFAIKDAVKKMVFKITAVDVAMMFIPGRGPVMLIRWSGKFVQFAGFMFIDHTLSTSIFRTFNNVWRPTSFAFDAMKIDRLWNNANRLGWDDRNAAAFELECPVQVPNCFTIKDLPAEIANFSKQTQQWREHLNAANEQDLAGWMEMTKKILNQVGLSYSFYRTYLNNLFDTLNVGNRIATNEADRSALNNYSRFPYRELPLYGVITPQVKMAAIPIKDQYLLTPHKLEPYQAEHVRAVVESSQAATKNLRPAYQAKWQNLAAKLTSDNVNEIGTGLIELNTIVGIYGLEKQSKAGYQSGTDYTRFLESVRAQLGQPLPVVYPGAGIAQAFSDSSGNLETAREANFSWSGITYSFNKDADYLTYQMVCGPKKGLLTQSTFFTDNFVPPSILKSGSKPVQLCNGSSTHVSSNSLYAMPLTDQNTKQTESGITNYITKHINYDVLGDFRDNKNKSQFDKWWMENVKNSLRPRFSDFDQKYKKLTQKTTDVLFGGNASDETYMDFVKTRMKNGIDTLNQSDYLQKTLLASLRFELEFYFDILESIDRTQNANPSIPVSLKQVVVNSKVVNSSGIFGKRSAELTELNLLFTSYFQMLSLPDMSFDNYNEVSKRVSDQIEIVKTKMTFDDKKFPIKQAASLASLDGIKLVESETRRFLRMKLLLSQTLDIDTQEFMSDIKSDDMSQKELTKVRSASPRGN